MCTADGTSAAPWMSLMPMSLMTPELDLSYGNAAALESMSRASTPEEPVVADDGPSLDDLERSVTDDPGERLIRMRDGSQRRVYIPESVAARGTEYNNLADQPKGEEDTARFNNFVDARRGEAAGKLQEALDRGWLTDAQVDNLNSPEAMDLIVPDPGPDVGQMMATFIEKQADEVWEMVKAGGELAWELTPCSSLIEAAIEGRSPDFMDVVDCVPGVGKAGKVGKVVDKAMDVGEAADKVSDAGKVVSKADDVLGANKASKVDDVSKVDDANIGARGKHGDGSNHSRGGDGDNRVSAKESSYDGPEGLSTEIRERSSSQLASREPTRKEIATLRKQYKLDSDSETAALHHVLNDNNTRSVLAGEAPIKKSLGIDPNKPGVKMTDMMKTEKGGQKVPIEVKNQKELHLVGEGNSALAKFEEIAKNANMKEISHFEVMANVYSKLPPNFKLDNAGKLHRLKSGSNPPQWDVVDIGGRNVYVKAAKLGEISQ